MLYSYYFDVDKKHQLNCEYTVLQYSELAAGRTEIMFSLSIEEIMDGSRKKRESIIQTFQFPAVTEDEENHDIDLHRVRHSGEKKWIFTAVNNRDNNQQAEIGLITDTANKNPLGLDVYHTNVDYRPTIKANNLSILNNYQPPILTQTLVNHSFNQPGYPERFNSYTANYDSSKQNFQTGDFSQGFLEAIPKESSFEIKANIAPMELSPIEGQTIFDLHIPNLGRISLLKTGIEYLIHNGTTGDVVRSFFEEAITIEKFWNINMTPASLLTIEGDGAGNLAITYGDITLNGVYDPSLTFSKMEFKGKPNEISEDPEDRFSWLRSRIDNLYVSYKK